MLVSIITVALNSRSTIEDTIKSVLGQTYKDVEYIIIDGGSTDGTLEIIRKYEDNIAKIVSGPDRGIYDAMNKGIQLASGDIVGILNSDDFYAKDSVLEAVVKVMGEKKVDACYGDLVYVDRLDTDRTIRYWKSCDYKEGLFEKGWMPPHPTFFVQKWVYEKYGLFNVSLPAASDFEILFRFMSIHGVRASYIPEVLIKMRRGGFSNKNLPNLLKQNKVIIKVLRDHHIRVSPFFLFSKFLEKTSQFFPGER